MGILTGIAPAYLDPRCPRWTSLSAHNLMAFPPTEFYWSFKPCKPGCIRICDFPYLESLESLIKQASEGSVAAEHTSKCWQCEKRSVHRIPANSRFCDHMRDMVVKKPTKKMDAPSSSHFQNRANSHVPFPKFCRLRVPPTEIAEIKELSWGKRVNKDPINKDGLVLYNFALTPTTKLGTH